MMEPIILFVDDEPAILRAIKRIFHRSNLQICTASNSVDALRILEQTPVSVMVSDYSMPEQNGAELLAQARTIRPETVRIILSGNNDQTATIEAINQGKVFKYLTKPFDKDTLIREVDAAVVEWQNRIFIEPEKKLLKQSALVQLINSKQIQNSDIEAIAVVLAIRDLDLVKEQLGNNETHQLLVSIAPSHQTLAEGVSLALLDEGHYSGFIELAANCPDPLMSVHSMLDKFVVNPIIDGRAHNIAFDVGYAVVDAKEVDGATLIRNAQLAMQTASDGQDSCAIAFDHQLISNRGRLLALQSGLRTALANDEFVLFYQPKIDNTNLSLHGAEALIRWNSETLGQVSPFEFIPLTERNGMIDEIGEWVINEAVRQWKSWYPDGDSGPAVSVNVSAVQLKNKEFIPSLERTLARHDLPPSLLELELTESLMVEDMNKVIEMLQAVKSLGVKLSIDDFGTGYSSLSYLSRLPVDTIKIDRSFIMPMLESNEKLAMVRNMIRLGHDLGMQLVAEGVEEEDQLLVLKELGCDITQGYYFSPPVAGDEFIGKTSEIVDSQAPTTHSLSVKSA